MVEIIPNWHPFLVHFTVALTLASAGLYLLAFLLRKRPAAAQLTMVARWNLWLGAFSAIPTFAAGLQAYYTVAHDAPSHAAMTIHMQWAIATLVLLIVAAGLAWWDRQRVVGAGAAPAVALLLAASALAVTGYLGAENVYRHGLGVMSLPQSEGGDGHDHDHGPTGDSEPAEQADDGHGHDHDPAPVVPAPANQGHSHAHGTADAQAGNDPAAVADAFTHALAHGDRDAVFQLLAPDVLIYESGGVEQSAEEYGGHHMPSDMAFLAAMDMEHMSRNAQVNGDMAIVTTRSRLRGNFRDSDVDVISTETLVMARRDGQWRITHIHWSSRAAAADH